MMREYLFRGKRADNGEWVEGYLLEQRDPEFHCYIVNSFVAEQDNRHTEILEISLYEVIPETVGQFTRLTDRNGKKIFKGDVVKCIGLELNGVVDFKHGAFGVNLRQLGAVRFTAFTSICNVEYEKIGNIHDNPELLEVQNEG